MKIDRIAAVAATLLLALLAPASARAQQPRGAQAGPADARDDMVRKLISRLDLEKYEATIKSLTQFGDRRQGTERNRKATDWIEAQLKSYGCATERVKYVYDPPPRPEGGRAGEGKPFAPVIASGEVRPGPGGSRYRGIQRRTGVNEDANA